MGGRAGEEEGGGGDLFNKFDISSYTFIYLYIPLYTFIYFYIPSNTFIYPQMPSYTFRCLHIPQSIKY